MIHIERIAMEKNDNNTVEFRVSVPKNRTAKDQRNPIPVTLKLGKYPHWGELHITVPQRAWRSLSDEEKSILIQKLKGDGLTLERIANALNVSKSTIEKFCQVNELTKARKNSFHSISTVN